MGIKENLFYLKTKLFFQNDDVVLEDLAKLRNVSPATFYNAFVADNLGEELYNAVLEKYKLVHQNVFKK